MTIDSQPKTIYLKDYQPPLYWIKTVDLLFDIQEASTQVTAHLQCELNEDQVKQGLPDLILDGKDLVLESVSVDGEVLLDTAYEHDADQLTLHPAASAFLVTIVTRLEPHKNTTLEGLYQSNGIYCTQCEAEGFRRITYYLDRPDVMAVFRTKIIASQSKYPVLLSNGNLVDRMQLPDDRHAVVWEDPFPKPAYLFAVVAGDLACHEDTFVTQSQRVVDLKIFTEHHYLDQCDYAMNALKRSMTWDEKTYGREYDLDIFMIVAIDAFNMGAMENKGLNIFNASCILGKPDTATDHVFQSIESIVGHEYFHNWSGNRVTCRDWFQLSLKEGLTVFRDQTFSEDMNSPAVQRIQDVNRLRTVQFLEDAGPMAHPVRPEKFIEISNFYTSTVYEKGAEVIRMLRNILGVPLFRKGCDLYFDRHDGQAVTCDDFVAAMESVSQLDLKQFKRWYWQSGTPRVQITDDYNTLEKTYTLTLKQSCPSTPGQSEKLPFVIPIKLGLLDAQNQPIPLKATGETESVFLMDSSERAVVFSEIPSKPIPSLLRSFSAPVTVEFDYTRADLVRLIQYDTDSFNRWDCMQRLAILVIQEVYHQIQANQPVVIDSCLEETYRALLLNKNKNTDWAVLAELLTLPALSYIGSSLTLINVHALYQARKQIKQHLAQVLSDIWSQEYERFSAIKPYQPVAQDIAERSFKNTCLSYLISLNNAESVSLSLQQIKVANNLTDTLAGLSGLIASEHSTALDAMKATLLTLESDWKDQSNLMNYWFSMQASAEKTDLDQIKALMNHSTFSLTNPNKVRSVIGAFSRMNLLQFHALDGSGYRFLSDLIIQLDPLNARMAAALLSPLTQWRVYDMTYQKAMKQALEKISQVDTLSLDVFEVVSKSLN